MNAQPPMRAIRAFAHRGGSLEAPENSLAAFQRAVRLGYTELETDVRGTSDGVAVIHHDATLDRTTDRAGRVSQMTWNEIRGARIHGREPILRLEDALEALPEARFTIDVKDAPSVPALIDVLRRIGSPDRITVGSFSHRRLEQVRRHLQVTTSASPREVLAVAWSRRPPRIPARFLQVPPRIGRRSLLTPAFMARAQAMGCEVHVWTLDDEASITAALDAGAHGIMTDRPLVLREILRRRGQW